MPIIPRTQRVKVCLLRFFSLTGSLVMEHPGEASSPFQGCILFGTVNGTIGETPLCSFCVPIKKIPSSISWCIYFIPLLPVEVSGRNSVG